MVSSVCCRRNVISTGRLTDQPAISILWWIPWRNTTCLSIYSESLKSQMPGYVKGSFMSFPFLYFLLKQSNKHRVNTQFLVVKFMCFDGGFFIHVNTLSSVGAFLVLKFCNSFLQLNRCMEKVRFFVSFL